MSSNFCATVFKPTRQTALQVAKCHHRAQLDLRTDRLSYYACAKTSYRKYASYDGRSGLTAYPSAITIDYDCYGKSLVGRYGSVGIATRYGLDVPGIEYQWRQDFSQTGPGAYPASYTVGTGSLSRGQSGRVVALITRPNLAPRLKK